MQIMHERSGAQWEQIQAFAAVAERGGFAAAGRALGRDASVISRRVDALEQRLGVRLVSRTTRRVSLTEAGARYLARVRAVLDELAAADLDVTEAAATPRGLLRLSLPAEFSKRWIAPWLPAFVAAYPDLQLELLHSHHFVDLVAEGFDAAVRIGQLPDSSLVSRCLASFDVVLCASPGYLERRGIPRQPDDLAHHACLGMTKARLWPDWKLRDGGQQVVQHVAGPIVSDDSEGLLVACVGGAGIMPAPEWLVGAELADGRLVRVLPTWCLDHEAAVHVVLPPGRMVPAKTRVFIDYLVQTLTPSAPWRRPGGITD